ncbi:ATP-binding cassette domain-containing protein [Halobacillus salinarum]|uniref:ATP-binding cassette domain-containing protein n=1 Tax=Halobacillus salinarum TaxID=2932257 RepID=A0ABY4ELH6_9BACI|nr:ATP-binding cassette domain-containing protein [Halobacillus salinarum]UOQ44718.1 ATP-binding cassette domain-containing protein [Halobacillus salinarum]
MLSVTIQKQLATISLDVSFQVDHEIVILFGPSGSGKTTTLNCIAGLTQPDQGKITLHDSVLYETEQKPLPIQKRRVGYLFQDYALFPHMTVLKNITYQTPYTEHTKQLVQMTGINHLLDKYPRQISGGEKQRVALVRALAAEPDLLLLDEPFSSLDEKTKHQCYEELLRLHQLWKIPVILVTHDETEARKLGNRILHLKQGKLTHEGELIKS